MIIGVTGTNGAGKGTVVEYLKTKGFAHYSARDFIVEEILRRGLPVNRDNTRLTANDLRKQFGPGYVLVELYKRAVGAGGNAVLESVRTVGEAQALKEKGALIWAVDADRNARYERSVLRGTDLDKISFEKFCAQEDLEMQGTEPWDMNVFGVMKLADHVFSNNGTQDELYQQVEAALTNAGVEL